MKRKLITLISALLIAVFSLGAFAGCDLLSTDNERDMAQVVAEVNVAKNTEDLASAFAALGTVTLSDEVESSLGELISTDEIYKRDLVTYFLSYGYDYINAGYSYADTFAMFMDALADRKIVSQFAALYYLSADEVTVDSDYVEQFEKSAAEAGYTAVDGSDGFRMDKDLSVAEYLAAGAGEDASADEAAIAKYSYFLTDTEVAYAEYLVKSAINDAIDSYEEQLLHGSAHDHDHSTTDRTTPTGVDTLASYYYPEEYAIYTGLNAEEDCGEYEAVEDSSRSTRRVAFARFISNLRANNLIGEGESISDPEQLSYYDIEFKTQLEQLVITKFMSTVSLSMSDAIEKGLLEEAYNEQVAAQQVSSASDFTSTMDSVSDTSFIVYSPENKTYGFVYNILLPFNANQELRLSELQAQYGTESAEYYAARAGLYRYIEATDQRGSWFNGEEDRSFDASASSVEYYKTEANSDYLFFEDSMTKSSEGIARYAGLYPYNGEAVYDEEDGHYKLTPAKLDIDAFIGEFESYIDFAAGASVASGTANSDFYSVTSDAVSAQLADDDYSFAVYYTGKVAGVSDVSSADYLVKDTVSYKALSAVNELMFAYTTDTAGLNTYFGYSVETLQEESGYVAEFEYAAQKLIADGANYGRGSYCVVATDYGWHIIYVTFTYDGGLVYEDGFVYADRNNEGTFSYNFYQSMKSSVVSEYTTGKQNELLTALGEESTTYYEDRYSDLTSIGA